MRKPEDTGLAGTGVGLGQAIWLVGLLIILIWFILWLANCERFVNGGCEEGRSLFLNEINIILLFTGGATFAIGLIVHKLLTLGKTTLPPDA